MRKFSYGIGLFFAVCILALGFYFSYEYSIQKDQPQAPQTLEADSPLRSGYHIGIEEGKVIVRLDDGSVYETTDISWEALPSSVQEEITRGYVLKSQQELYSFLENFTS